MEELGDRTSLEGFSPFLVPVLRARPSPALSSSPPPSPSARPSCLGGSQLWTESATHHAPSKALVPQGAGVCYKKNDGDMRHAGLQNPVTVHQMILDGDVTQKGRNAGTLPMMRQLRAIRPVVVISNLARKKKMRANHSSRD